MNEWGKTKKILCRVEWAGKFRRHTRPVSQEFFTIDGDSKIWSDRILPGTGADGRSYGVNFSRIGEGAFTCRPEFSQPSGEIKWQEKRRIPTYFIDPAMGCPQCGSLWCDNDSGAALDFIRLRLLMDSETKGVTAMQYAVLLSWIIKNNKNHPILVSRCNDCRMHYKGLFDHIKRRSGNQKFAQENDRFRIWSSSDDADKRLALDYLLSIGKSKKDESKNTSAKKSIMRHLRRKYKKLTKAELTFFQMFAGVNAIKTQGGKYGTRNRNAA
jgi:hypothetical protein